MWWLCLLWCQTQPVFVRPIDPDRDLARLENQIRQDSLDEALWLEKLSIYTQVGELHRADQLVEILSQVRPDHPVFQEAKMMSLAHRGMNAEAAELGLQLLERFPQHRTLRTNLARVFLKMGRFAEAINQILAQLELHELSSSDWSLLFLILARSEQPPQQVLDTLLSKIEANPESRGLLRVYLVLLVRFGRYDEALTWTETHPDLVSEMQIAPFVASLRDFQ